MTLIEHLKNKDDEVISSHMDKHQLLLITRKGRVLRGSQMHSDEYHFRWIFTRCIPIGEERIS